MEPTSTKAGNVLAFKFAIITLSAQAPILSSIGSAFVRTLNLSTGNGQLTKIEPEAKSGDLLLVGKCAAWCALFKSIHYSLDTTDYFRAKLKNEKTWGS